MLRASLDREKVLVTQRDAADAHIKTLEKEIAARSTTGAVDAAAIKNLQDQKQQLQVETVSLRDALSEQRAATASLRTALERAEIEVERQKKKVKAANRRTMYGVLGGVIIGVISAIAIQKR